MKIPISIDSLTSLFFKKITSILVVDITSGLKLFNIELAGEAKINALSVIELKEGKREETIVNAIHEFLSKNNIQHKDALLVPLLNSTYAKRIQMPIVPEEELAEAVKWKLKDDLPFDLAKAVFDYRVVKKSVLSDGSKAIEILCVAAEEEEVRKQVLLLKQAGLNCIGVSLLPFGYAKFIEKYLGDEKEKHFGILHITENNSHICVYYENAIVFFRRLPIAIDKLKESLRTELLTEKGRVRLSEEEIDEVLFKHGVPVEDSPLYKDKIAANQILAMLRPGLEMLAQEIKRSFTYYQSQFQGGSIDKIVICGEALKIPNIDKFLSKELSLDLSVFHLPEKLKFSAGINTADLLQGCADIGLALAYPQTINLLPIEFRTEKIERFQKISLRWVGFVAFLLLVVSYILARAGVDAYQKRLYNAMFQLNVLSEIKQIKTKVDAFDEFFQEIKSQQINPAQLLGIISIISDRDLFLTSLDISGASRSGSLAGFVRSKNNMPETILTRFVSEMDGSGYFQETGIAKLTNTSVQGMDAVMFEITFKIR